MRVFSASSATKHIAAYAAVTAIRATALNIFFATKTRQPLLPLPACTRILASSINCMVTLIGNRSVFRISSLRSYRVIKPFGDATGLHSSVQIQKTPHLRGFYSLLPPISGAATSPTRRCPLPKRYHVDGFAAQMSFHRKLDVTIGLRKSVGSRPHPHFLG